MNFKKLSVLLVSSVMSAQALAGYSDLFNSLELINILSSLKSSSTYQVSDVTPNQEMDDGSQVYNFKLTPTDDFHLSCFLSAKVIPYMSGAERVVILSNDCPKIAN